MLSMVWHAPHLEAKAIVLGVLVTKGMGIMTSQIHVLNTS